MKKLSISRILCLVVLLMVLFSGVLAGFGDIPYDPPDFPSEPSDPPDFPDGDDDEV